MNRVLLSSVVFSVAAISATCASAADTGCRGFEQPGHYAASSFTVNDQAAAPLDEYSNHGAGTDEQAATSLQPTGDDDASRATFQIEVWKAVFNRTGNYAAASNAATFMGGHSVEATSWVSRMCTDVASEQATVNSNVHAEALAQNSSKGSGVMMSASLLVMGLGLTVRRRKNASS